MRGIRLTIAIVLSALAGCGEVKKAATGDGAKTSAAPAVRLRATGSSFVERMMKKWAPALESQGGRIDYQATGSGKGIQDMLNGETDFGCTDAPLTADQLSKAGGADKVVQVPLVMGGVAVVYNLTDLKSPLNLDGAVLAGIYLGTIKNWNDRVGPNDKVYHLGDVVINRKALGIMRRLNGDKVLIRGNHDIFRDDEYREH
ncbi:MAG: hypothetical protein EBS30_06540, partial [Planctomycetes bacterium]|nr:hypothetical protein [Planctomycetota bacterium]